MSEKICPKCGGMAEGAFCPNCGQKLDEPLRQTTEQSPPVQDDNYVSAAAAMEFKPVSKALAVTGGIFMLIYLFVCTYFMFLAVKRLDRIIVSDINIEHNMSLTWLIVIAAIHGVMALAVIFLGMAKKRGSKWVLVTSIAEFVLTLIVLSVAVFSVLVIGISRTQPGIYGGGGTVVIPRIVGLEAGSAVNWFCSSICYLTGVIIGFAAWLVALVVSIVGTIKEAKTNRPR